MNQSIHIRGSVHIKLNCISEMLDDFPEVTQPESTVWIQTFIFLAPKSMMFYNNHTTFCLKVMKT